MGQDVTLFAEAGSACPPGGQLVVFGQRDGHLSLDVDQLLSHDVVHFHEWSPLAVQLAQLHPERRVFQSWHGPSIGPWTSWRRPPDNLVLCGVSETHAAELSAELDFPCAAVPNGIHLEDYPLNVFPRENYLCYVARVCHEKGLHRAIAAAREIGMPLRIAGSEHIGADPEYTRAMLARCDGRQVIYEGDLGLRDKVELLQHATALLHLAPGFVEPFGMAPVEAMACGTPVVSYPTGAAAEVIGEGGRLIVRPDQVGRAIARAAEIPPATCRANAERYSDRRMARGYLEVYGDPERRAASGRRHGAGRALPLR
jgi:glycosyltransferase involved in cell wall biosynthesis